MTVPQGNSEVSQAELVSNVRYGYWFNHLCERLYSRTDFVLNIVQMIGGSAAALGVIQKIPAVSAAAGIALAVAAAVSLLTQPAIKAERHRRAKCDYLDLEAKAWKLSFDELSTELYRVRHDAPTGVDVLAVPAYNATLRAIGEDAKVMPESALQRLARAIA